jgi:hypothetical protein
MKGILEYRFGRENYLTGLHLVYLPLAACAGVTARLQPIRNKTNARIKRRFFIFIVNEFVIQN